MVSNITQQVDSIFLYIVGVSLVLLVGVTAVLIYFIIRFRESRHPVAKPVHESLWLELTWTLIPTVLVISMFWFGYEGFRTMRNVPANAMVVKVYAEMWKWSFEYSNGITTENLYVPLQQPVKLILVSKDVVHGFYMPAFRVKEDVVPGKENYLWFEPLKLGEYDIFCSLYCGERHSYMLTKARVIERAEFQKWFESGGKLSVPSISEKVKFREKLE